MARPEARHVIPFGINEQRTFQRHIREPESLVGLGRGVVSLDGAPCLSDEHPMIVYRFPSRNDDSRTMIALALPESGFLFSAGYCHGIRHPADTSTPQKLALLGWLNSYTCDWWVRRFADRHVNAAIVNRLPVPLWTDAEIGHAAELVAELSGRAGIIRFAGGDEVHDGGALADKTTEELRVELELLALRGGGLNADDFQSVISADFSSRPAAGPPTFREAVSRERP